MSEYEDDFNKIYFFKNHGQYSLPNEVFVSQKWSVPELQTRKQELNNVKGLLGKYVLKEWSDFTSKRDRAGLVMRKLSEKIKPELLTQAWCKFYEILAHFPIIPLCAVEDKKLESLHLCEAPGAFVSALNHYLLLNYPGLNWSWNANSLNPNYEGNDLCEMIPDDRFIRHTLSKWIFGSDFTGDITKFYNYKYLVDYKKDSKISLITADGSVNCMNDPGEQERCVERLHFCETITALTVLQTGGTFVLKIFTMFEESTINLLFLLNNIFEKVAVFKPCTSKSGNSEVYVISTKYKGFNAIKELWPMLVLSYENADIFNSKSMFSVKDIPQMFLDEIINCSEYFMNKQTHTILNNIHNFEHRNYDNIQMVKSFIAQIYISRYELKPIPDEFRIIPYLSVSECRRVYSTKKPNNFYKLKTENIIRDRELGSILHIVQGKEICTVYNSKFIHQDNLKKLKLFANFTLPSCLYRNITKMLSQTNAIINVNDFEYQSFSSFQKQFFEKLSLAFDDGKNLILINIPFVTHFLVGLLYILLFSFDTIFIGNGIIFLSQPKISTKSEVKDIFSKINETYQNLDKTTGFINDIVQIVSPILFEYGRFIDCIWNYNNHIYFKEKCYVRRLKM
ncbi:unnamed protein product [Phyllotreta striolata]|uniref:Cap-specific mRNA (nucleoside-2'-O-)-methyltransferase 2 n=1 Tax=Phyllotreta striolata TaxID=444603 RepID=A0A9N9TLP1_PHYSR|nr:unnamed protein product [Phyllotreta striolata]